MSILEVHNLSKTYGDGAEPALTDFNFSIAKGEIVGLLGPNGAGKTTAIAIMTGLLRPDRGRVAICGIDAARHPRRVRRNFGLIPQQIALYPELTARENLTYFGRIAGLGDGKLRERVRTCLEAVGLESHAHKRIDAFSGGMQRRANIAAGILHQPALLFLDEPTVGIDAHSRDLILTYLQALKGEGVGMLYTTHYMEEAAILCDRVAVIEAGRIIIDGQPDELLAAHPQCRDLGELFLHLTGRALRD